MKRRTLVLEIISWMFLIPALILLIFCITHEFRSGEVTFVSPRIAWTVTFFLFAASFVLDRIEGSIRRREINEG